MIPRLHKAGASFKFAVEYVTHDPDQSQSSERVAWTHTFNCAHDHIPSAVHEMVLTSRDAEWLKEESGAGAGGGAVKRPVKHFTLSWHPDESPTREEMIEAAESYLEHMKWQEHQCVLAAHTDKDHVHLHGILNAIHPETGLKLDDSFEYRRSQEWALEYEKARGQIYCEQRMQAADEREPAPPRNVYDILKSQEEQHLHNEAARVAQEMAQERNATADPTDVEWKALKEYQKQERKAFFADGKAAYGDACKEVYRDVREIFRPQWAEYYAAQRDGLDAETLVMARTAILEEQQAMLEERQKAACDALRLQRDAEYADLLKLQQDERGMLRDRQAEGLSSPELLESLADRIAFAKAGHDPVLSHAEGRVGEADAHEQEPWRLSADEVTARDLPHDRDEESFTPARDLDHADEPQGGGDRPRSLGFLSGLIGLAGSFLSALDPSPMGPSERRPRSNPPEFPPEQFKRFADDARAEAEKKDKEEYDRAWWEDRERRRDW